MIPFGEWLPDQPDHANPGATEAKNVYPAGTTYRPIGALTAISDAMNAYARGAITARDKDGNVYSYCGTASKLYSLGATVTDVSGAVYTTDTEHYWEFAKWGEKVIGTNFADAPQIVTMGGVAFADLTGSPPKARHIGVVRDFVVLGNTYDAVDGGVPNRVRWSAYNDETGWAVGTSQADYQDLAGDGGWVQRVVGGEYGIVFQERSIWRMTYVGSPLVFQFDEVEPGRGTPAPGSVVRLGRHTYYIGQDGFYDLIDGTESIPIGAEKVNRYLFERIDESYWHRVSAAIDPRNNLVVWAIPTGDSVGGTPSELLIYNWATKRWSRAVVDVELLFDAATFGYTLEELDSFGTLDSLAFSLDSRVWMGGNIRLGAVDSTHKLGYFDGTSMDAVVETAEIGGDAIYSVTEVRPYVHGDSNTTVTVQIGTRSNQTSTTTWGTATSPDASGKSNHRNTARYLRARVNISGGFEHAAGIDANITKAGRR